VIGLFANAGLQGLTFGIAALGLAFAFRVLRYPDLTGDGSFMLGAALFALSASRGEWLAGLVIAFSAGALAGLLTAQLNARLGVGRLLSGIITTMIAYSLAFRLLGGRSNIGLTDVATMFGQSVPALVVASGFALVCAALVGLLLSSEAGLVLRATGRDEALVRSLDRSPASYRTAGLCLANGLIGIAGGLVAAQQGFADISMGMGTIITLVAALVIGEQSLKLVGGNIRLRLLAAPFLGAFLYFLLYLAVLHFSLTDLLPISVMPTDLKMLAALCVVAMIALQRRGDNEEVLPL
jgi:putative ABC transport system permease protein